MYLRHAFGDLSSQLNSSISKLRNDGEVNNGFHSVATATLLNSLGPTSHFTQDQNWN